MRRSLPLSFVPALLALSCSLISGAAHAGELQLGGYVETNHYIGLVYGDLFDYGNTNILGLKLDAEVNPEVVAKGVFEFRNKAFTGATTSSLLGDRSAVEPLQLRMQEAYIDLYALGTERLDLRIGKQVIRWGAADGMNPTSFLAPFDLENPLDFSTHLGVPAVLATVYGPADTSLAIALVPLFTPSLLPVDLFASEMAIPFELPDYVQMGATRDHLAPPRAQLRHSQLGLRLAGSIADIDLSASYFYGYQTLPQLGAVDVGLDLQSSPWTANVDATLVYPRTQAIGLDAATTFNGIGVWAEAALFLPERLDAIVTVMGEAKDPLTGEAIPSLPIISSKPYLKAVLGLDVTLPGDLYLNAQYLHGFFQELTAEKVQDYALLILRKPLLDESLSVELRLGAEFDDSSHLGGMAGGEISWQPSDATRLTLGGLAARGDAGTTYNGFASLDQLYMRARVDF